MRVSPTDKKGRIHTSLITVAVLRVPETNELTLNSSDYEFRFVKASSKGGQHANKTESGVVIKHKATGIEVKSVSDRSQQVNKTFALEMLKSKLLQLQEASEIQKTDNVRSQQIGSGHRSDKIRTIRVVDNSVKCEMTNKTKSYKEYCKGHIEF
jgi:peptide chain release factor 1